MNRPIHFIALVPAASLLALLSACGGGASETEFVQACVKSQASQSECECAAKTAKDSMSGERYKMMVLDMQGKKQEVEALAQKMSFADRAAFAAQQFEVLGKCVSGK